MEVDLARAEGVLGTLDLRRWSRVWARVDWPVDAAGVLDGLVRYDEVGIQMGMGIGFQRIQRTIFCSCL